VVAVRFTKRVNNKSTTSEAFFYKAHKQYYNELAQKVIDFCKSKGINYHIKSKTITE